MRDSLLSIIALTLAAVVTSPDLAFAQPCLTGDALDQRAITDVRAAVEEECPCASYDGSSGGTRRDYEACVQDVLAREVASGALREECRTVASHAIDEATCGTKLVACGKTSSSSASCSIGPEALCRSGSAARVLPSRGSLNGDGPIRIRRPAGTSSDGSGKNVCSAETHCADVVEWTAGTCLDPREEGPYAPGVRVLSLTRPSSVDGQPRLLETAVWYPAPPGSGVPDNTELAGIMDAPLDESGGPYPIVMFSHGSCGWEGQSKFLTPFLATHGFIVVATPHPGNTLFEFPACGQPAAQARSAAERPNDIIFALDRMLDANQDPLSPFFGSVDPERIGMSGHSFGGFTTFLATGQDPRFKVAIPMAAGGPIGTLSFDIPSLAIIGAVDSVVDNDLNVAAFESSSSPKWLVTIENTGHYAFSDGCFPSPDCEPPLVLTQDEAHARLKRWVLPFLKVFLEGDTRYEPFLTEDAGPSFAVDKR